MNKRKLSDAVYLAKGVGISLVVIGHFYFPDHQPDMWIKIRKIIYLYHMPLFMFLSGFLYVHKSPTISCINDYKLFIKKKLKRLMLPYLSMGICVALLKFIFQKFSVLGQSIDHQFYMYLLFNPEAYFTVSGGYARFLWFLYTLFVIFAIFPVLEIIFKNHIYILIFALLLSYFEYPAYFCINHAIYYLPHFTFGAITYHYLKINNNVRSRKIMVITLFSAVVVLLTPLATFLNTKGFLVKYFLGFSGSIFILFIFYNFINERGGIILTFLKRIGMHSVTIYLFHFIVMSPIILVIYNFFDIPNRLFIPLLLVVYSFGVGVPILIERYVLSRSKLLMTLFLGK